MLVSRRATRLLIAAAAVLAVLVPPVHRIAGSDAGLLPRTGDGTRPTGTTSGPPLPLRNATDPGLEASLHAALESLGLARLVRGGRIGVALADLSQPGKIRYAGVNDDRMMYAASLPKIAVLLTAFDRVEAGTLKDSPQLRATLTDMIRYSNNAAASRAIRQVGFGSIAHCLQLPRYRLYDPDAGGGLWVGKAYDHQPAVARDPLRGLSHGATARQAARFFVLLNQGLLVSPEKSREMKTILGEPGIHHNFVRGLDRRPGATIFRKSGTYRSYHADAALIERNGHRYVATAIVEDPRGGRILERLIVALDDLVTGADSGAG